MSSAGSSGSNIVIKQKNFTVSGNVYTVAGNLIQNKQSGLAEFEQVLRVLREELAELDASREQPLPDVGAQLDAVSEEIKKPKPSQAGIVSVLNQVKATLVAAGGTTKEAWQLAKTVGAIAGWASVYFG